MDEKTLERFNALSESEAIRVLLKCCAAKRWARRVASGRPILRSSELNSAALRAFDGLEERDWLEAFAGHPRIGDIESVRSRFPETGDWSAGEQAGVVGSGDQTLRDLATGNAEYEERFGYVFIICAIGKSADEILSALRARLHNSPGDELNIAAAEQRRITVLRLEKTHAMSSITTHVLDTGRGKPAAGVPVALERLGDDDRATEMARGITDDDGRVADLTGGLAIARGNYRLVFDTEAYFRDGKVESFYPRVVVVFRIERPEEHYHVPLLLSPFGYSTYRGS